MLTLYVYTCTLNDTDIHAIICYEPEFEFEVSAASGKRNINAM